MKKSYYPAVIILTVCFLACHKGSGTQPAASLVGKWAQGITLDTVNLAGNITIQQIPKPSPIMYYQFNSDGTGESIDTTFVIEKFDYKITNSEVYCYNDSLLYEGTSPCSDCVSFVPEAPYTERMVTLTSNQLVFYERDTFTVNSQTEVHSYRTYYSLSQ